MTGSTSQGADLLENNLEVCFLSVEDFMRDMSYARTVDNSRDRDLHASVYVPLHIRAIAVVFTQRSK